MAKLLGLDFDNLADALKGDFGVPAKDQWQAGVGKAQEWAGGILSDAPQWFGGVVGGNEWQGGVGSGNQWTSGVGGTGGTWSSGVGGGGGWSNGMYGDDGGWQSGAQTGYDDPFAGLQAAIARANVPAPATAQSGGQGVPGAGGVGATGADPATDRWRELIDEAAAQYGIDGDAIQAVMMIESQGNENARSGAGAAGLMQVMPFHFQPGENPMDPRTNVMKGAQILADNYRRYGNWDSAVAAYLGAVDANGKPTTAADMYGTTGIAYAQKFNQYYQQIKQRRQPQGGSAPVNAQGAAFPVVGYQGQVQLHHGSHNGAADIFAPAGTGVAAIRGGRVVSAGYSDLGGWNVTIQGDDGLTYYYAHLLNQPSVQAGQTIGAGSVFGQVGDTGNAKGTGAHLHIGIGYGIQSGAGPGGGAGINFNATQYLQQLLGIGAHYAGDGHNH